MYLHLNIATISLLLIGVHSIMLFFTSFGIMIAAPSLWSLSFLPEYIIVLPSDVVAQPLSVHLHSLMPKMSTRWSTFFHLCGLACLKHSSDIASANIRHFHFGLRSGLIVCCAVIHTSPLSCGCVFLWSSVSVAIIYCNGVVSLTHSLPKPC